MDKLIYETGFGILPKSIMMDTRISLQAKGVFAYLVTYAGNGDTAFPKRETIMYHLNISKDSLTKYLKELKDNGYLEVSQAKSEKGRFAHNIYKLVTYPKLPDTVSPDTVKPPTNINSSLIKTKNKKERKKEETYNDIISSYTKNEDLKEALVEFIKMRKNIKSPMTNRALKLLLTSLDKLASNETIKIDILNQSILNNWKGVFPLKDNMPKTSNNIPKYDKNGFEIEY